jgi:hypothetical protein
VAWEIEEPDTARANVWKQKNPIRRERMYGTQRGLTRGGDCVGQSDRIYSDYLDSHPRVEAAPCLIANDVPTVPFRVTNTFSARFLSS